MSWLGSPSNGRSNGHTPGVSLATLFPGLIADDRHGHGSWAASSWIEPGLRVTGQAALSGAEAVKLSHRSWSAGAPTTLVAGIPFDLAPAAGGALASLRCCGQLVGLPPARYDWIALLGGANGPVTAEVMVHYRTGCDPEWVRLVRWAPRCDRRKWEGFDGLPRLVRVAFVPTPRRDEVMAVRLPKQPEIQIFAATLLAPRLEVGP